MRKALLWIALLALGMLSACRFSEVTVENGVTSDVTRSVALGAKPGATPTERTVVVTKEETVQVVITSTPTPIPVGGFLVRTTFADAETANPILAADDGSRALTQFIFEGLLRIDPFTGELVPNLAERWEQSQDGLTYTFAIRSDLKWSDGQPITAHDFHFSYAALMSGALDTPNVELAANIEAIAVLDDQTFTVTFSEPDCSNLERLQLGWIPMHVFADDVDTYDFGELALHEFNNRPTVFSGPFILEEWVRGDHWTQVRNDRYWRGAPYLEGVVTQVIEGQAAMVRMLTSGQVDIGSQIKPQYLAELELEPNLHMFKFLSDSYDFVGFQLGDPDDPQPRLNPDGTLNKRHGRHPILKDPAVRAAIAYALDREEIIARTRFGQAIPLHTNVLPAVSWAYNADLEPYGPDLEKANALLEQAGWVKNEYTGVRVKNGVPLRLRLYTNAGNAIREAMGEVLQEQLLRAGIEVELITLEWYAFLDVLYGQAFDMVLISWSDLGVDPDDSRFWRAASDSPGSGPNFVSYYNPEVEAKYAEAKAAPGCDQDLRTALYRQIQAQLHEDQPYLWIDVPRNLVAINQRIGGVNPGAWNLWHNVHKWYIVPE